MPGYDEERLHPANGRQQRRDVVDHHFQIGLARIEVMFDEWCQLNGSRDNLEHLRERLHALQQRVAQTLAGKGGVTSQALSVPVSKEGQRHEVSGQ